MEDNRWKQELLDDLYQGYTVKECAERYDIPASEVREILRRDREE